MTDTNREEYVYQVDVDEHVSEAILRAVAAVSDRSPVELPPLQESVDLDSLDRAFESSAPGDSLQISVEYEAYEIAVEPERVRVRTRPD